MESPIVWAEVDLSAIAHNVRELRRVTRPEARLMAVVKANAYGHGILEVAERALQSGADRLGVARLNEAIVLREAGFKVPVLIFGYTPPSLARRLFEFDLTQTVYARETAEALSRAARENGKKISVHLKVDTGMGRLGILSDRLRTSSPDNATPADAVREAESIARLNGLKLEGIYTHFATADCAEKSFAKEQFDHFIDFLNELRRQGLEIPIRHAANSGAIIDMPETHLDMVRAGISLYGLYPSDEVDKRRISLKPAMALKARVVHLKKVPAGFSVSYGCTYQTAQPTTIATVPVGYADGFNRRLSSRGRVLVAGRKAPIIGRVCMDQIMIDVGHIPQVNIGDEVVIFGRQNNTTIPVEEVAAELDTINYEIVSALTVRVPRIYLE